MPDFIITKTWDTKWNYGKRSRSVIIKAKDPWYV